MDTKKLITYALIGFVFSGIFFGTIAYFAFFRNTESVNRVVKTYEYALEDFTTNLSSTRSHFRGSIIIETTNKRLVSKFEEKNTELRDGVIQTLIAKKPEDLLDQKGLDDLRDEIKELVIRVVNSDEITNIYFIDYIIQ
ncbi:flagellar basal body-associated FliL family protein [Alkaliphilus transvaalensis]|uniref:flagellar basal body-associated FliL family protein n=1 Tax=Alkaliphilus transvaalensis TaxID=114628 RepID=UPI00047E5013|nr:flagellar basal body-associated FliL family protein [Alkaliphilus transvaalensis]